MPAYAVSNSHDHTTGADSLTVDLFGPAEAVLQRNGDNSLRIAVQGKTTYLTFLRPLSGNEHAELRRLTDEFRAKREGASSPQASTVKAASYEGTEASELLDDPAFVARFGLKQKFGNIWDDLTCAMGASAPVEVEDGRYLAATAASPPACGEPDQTAAFVVDFQTGEAVAMIDMAVNGRPKEVVTGDHRLVNWYRDFQADKD